MINTKLQSQITTNKSDLKNDLGITKDSKDKLDSKELLSQALKKNLGLKDNVPVGEIVEKLNPNETLLKFKELMNKVLNQIGAQKNPNSPMLKQANLLNLAPNFTGELKSLSVELEKNPAFSELLNKLEQILKPASEIKATTLTPLLKNSGVFFEAKLKDALNEDLLPKSFYNLLNSIKSLSNEKISAQITELATLNLSPKESLDGLKKLIVQNLAENKQILQKSPFKPLLNLAQKIENFKNYINKNPQIAGDKIENLATHFLKELKAVKNDFIKVLSKPENLIIKDPKPLNEALKSFEKLENTLKTIIKEQGQNHAFKKDENLLKDLLQNKVGDKNTNKNLSKESIKENEAQKLEKNPTQEKSEEKKGQISLENKDNTSKESIRDDKKEPSKNSENPKEISKESPKNTEKENPKINLKENTKEILQENSKERIKDTVKFYENKGEEKPILTKNIENPPTKTTENSLLKATENPTLKIAEGLKNQEFIKANTLKNLAFSTESGTLEELENLGKDLAQLGRKISESLKQLDPLSQNAKINLNELKNLDRKIELSAKDLQNIRLKNEQDIASEIHSDIKSTLLQISSVAKNEGNEAVYNQANRLLAQIEMNQLLSLANDSINTYLPFSWEDLNGSKIIFRRGKKDKFFAQIKLEFARLGDLEILVSLNNEKYIDINIMAENKDFRKIIYENAHELKRSINKAGLLSANFFVGDIIRSPFDPRGSKNLDLEMGMDKKV